MSSSKRPFDVLRFAASMLPWCRTCIIALVSLSSCAPGFRTFVPAQSEVDCNGVFGHGGVQARLARRPCDGYCPVYQLTVCADGTVVYDGEVFVKTHGRKVSKLSADALSALVHELDRVPDGPGPLGDSAGGGPAAHVQYVKGGVQRWLATDAGGGVRTADLVERAVGAESWVGTEAERERLWQTSR